MRWRHRWRRGSILASAETLAAARPGSKVKIVSLPHGHGPVMKLLTLGITPGRIVRVVSNNSEYPWAPVIVEVGGLEVAVGRGLASKIVVEPLEKDGVG